MDKRMLEEYPRLDLSPLLERGKFVIHCQTEYEAQCLLAEMKRSYPDKCKGWDLPYVHWEDTEGRGQLYFPDINDAEGWRFCWNDMDYPDIHEYIIIECADLICSTVDISESELPINFLVGGGV